MAVQRTGHPVLSHQSRSALHPAGTLHAIENVEA